MTGIAETDRLAVFDDVRHHQHLRMTRQLELMQHMNLQRTKAPAESNLLVRRDALIAEHQHVMIEVSTVDAREIVLAQRLAEIEPENFRADGAVERANLDGLGLNGVAGLAGGSGSKGSRHRKLFVDLFGGRRRGRSPTNVPARTRGDNEANPIRLSAGVINPML
jgi:hypothetical protein